MTLRIVHHEQPPIKVRCCECGGYGGLPSADCSGLADCPGCHGTGYESEPCPHTLAQTLAGAPSLRDFVERLDAAVIDLLADEAAEVLDGDPYAVGRAVGSRVALANVALALRLALDRMEGGLVDLNLPGVRIRRADLLIQEQAHTQETGGRTD